MQITIKQYYGSYKSLLGILATVALASPILTLIPLGFNKYIFPPLGGIDVIARLGSFACALIATYAVYFCQEQNPKSGRRLIFGSIGFFVLFAIIYAAAYLCSVRTIPIPSKDTSVSVSIGYRRSNIALRDFAGVSDEDLLRDRGPVEEEIRNYWTTGSLIASRLVLWISCTAELTFLVSSLGFGIILLKDQDLSQPD
jgi:hypothetical protein